ncbi:MAG: hypothetical protein H8M99_14650 [Gloeobacteraceae cyanobacterium ES-bin-144]|nr:hypothetical protein [Verrucomicrobiales bacterium]
MVKGIWQATTILFLSTATLVVAQQTKAYAWEPIKVTKSIFTQDLGMLDSEREEYAKNLATIAVNQIVTTKASPPSLAEARKMLTLALQLSPRNKRAVVVNFQLSKGILPETIDSNYSAQVFARLLLTRGQLLEKQGGEENHRLARYFIQLAASLDPKNEDAVYASEVLRLDHGDPVWSALTDEAEAKP